MNTGLTLAAVFIGAIAGIVFWPLTLQKQIKYFGIGLLMSFLMVFVRLSLTESNVGFVDALINPPAWKFLALIFATSGILVAIVLKVLLVKKP